MTTYFSPINCPANKGSLNSPNYELQAAHYIYNCGAANKNLISSHYPFQGTLQVPLEIVSVPNDSKVFYYPAVKPYSSMKCKHLSDCSRCTMYLA